LFIFVCILNLEIEIPRSRSNRAESIPLKGSVSSEDDALLRVIIGAFIGLSAAVTIALAAQIYVGVYQVFFLFCHQVLLTISFSILSTNLSLYV